MEELFSESKAPKEVVGEKPEEPKPEIEEEAIFALLEWVSNKDTYEIKGFIRVDLYTNGYAEAYGVEPEEFEDFLEKNIYDVEDPYLKIVSEETAFNQMLASHWNQLPLMWKFNGYSGILKLDEKGLDELIDKYGWQPDKVKPDESKKE
jgi:hypothetical protein